ncbi:AMP-binding protein [Sandarakinorhabdus sp.]|uniref:AMP-binding protein n=1 Tax=Sandarakinorhabdus sp. TaxID=1916663 RepID=UPI00286D8749|nr:AMP-binding protein [Sandarakinorhabdus sp.]
MSLTAAPPCHDDLIGFAEALASHGDRPALICADGRVISYAALAAAADAAPLPPVRCLVALPMAATPDAVIFYLACLRRRYPVILMDDTDSLVGKAVRAAYAPWMPGEPLTAAGADLHPDLAVLLSTSGSTGSPKLVRLSARNIASNAASIAEYLGIVPTDRAVTSLPLHYSYGLSVLNSHLAAGAAILLTETSVSDPAFWQQMEAHGITHLAGVPHAYELFERMGLRGRALPALRTLTQAGGRLPADMVQTYAEWAAACGKRFFVMYGQTEATARIAYLPPDLAVTHADCIGIAIPGGSLSATEPMGELVYRGPNVMMGYASAPADLARGPELDALHTGDLAEQTTDGLFRITGRMSRFSKLFGLRVSHDAVEAHLAGRGIAALVGGDDKALTILHTGPAPVGLARDLAAHFGLPADAFLTAACTELPRLPTGKPDHGGARAMVLAAQADASENPGDVAAVFARSFPGRAIAPDDSFTTLGGDSLGHVTFAIALEDIIGQLPGDWPSMSLSALAALQPAAPPVRGWLRRVDSDLVVRAAAIAGVVLVHTGVHVAGPGAGIGGGALALMILFGFNLARFQQQRLLGADRLRVVGDFFRRVMLPYIVILLAYGLYKQQLDWHLLLLVGNLFGHFGDMLEPYWFLEAVAQCLLITAGIMAVPAARTLAAERPKAFAVAFLAGAALLKAGGALLLDQQQLQHRGFDANLAYVALGWAAAVLTRPAHRLALIAVAAVFAMGDWGMASSRLAWAVGVLTVIGFVPRIALPRPAAALVIAVAKASFMIYLTHLIVINLIELRLGYVAPYATLVMAVALGVVLQQAQELWAARTPRPLAKPAAPAP